MVFMIKSEKRKMKFILNLDCYDQELWVVDNYEFIANASTEFKSFIKDLDFETGQSALENSNADFYKQTTRG
jgi:hypothetical protein